MFLTASTSHILRIMETSFLRVFMFHCYNAQYQTSTLLQRKRTLIIKNMYIYKSNKRSNRHKHAMLLRYTHKEHYTVSLL
jgi:hypothetical protein